MLPITITKRFDVYERVEYQFEYGEEIRPITGQYNTQRLIDKADKVARTTVFTSKRIREEMLHLLEQRGWSFDDVDDGIEEWMKAQAIMGVK